MAISDKIGQTNSTVVNRLCRSDGVLFRPARPATAMDSTFRSIGGPNGEMWHTYASDEQQTLFVEYVMVTNLTESYRFSWEELFNTQNDEHTRRIISSAYVVFDLAAPMDYDWLTSNDSSTIRIPACAQNLTTFFSPFHLFVFVPYSPLSKWILFGELTKQLPISKQRFKMLDYASTVSEERLQLDVIGAGGEQVSVTVGYSEQLRGKIDVYTVQCSFLSTPGVATMSIHCVASNGCRCG